MNEDINKFQAMAVTGNDPEDEIPGDPPVYYTQVWLNQTYGYHSSWVPLLEDGITGWGTIYGLVRALQIYLGVGADGDFGNGTKVAFEQRFSSTGGEVRPVLYAVDNIYGIISGALWCKGYYGSFEREIDCRIDEKGTSSIWDLKRDAGLSTSNNYINALLMKALLSMDQFVLLESSGGKSSIRTIQQYLNANFGDYVGIIPCDGLYQREINRALIKRLQFIEGYWGADVDGIFGNGTKNNLPILSINNQPAEAVRLFCFCLTCNGYSISSTSWTSDVAAKTRSFQAKHLIPQTGVGDTNTWMALLLSKGNPDRAAAGCDCATILDSNKATALYNAGYRYVGRYVSGTVGSGVNERSKALTKSEMAAIFNAGLRVFAIYQEGGVYLERYTYARGLQDAENAISAAVALEIPMREYIYFAVDYDVMDGYIEPYVVPYFQAINEVMASYGNRYHIGIYGARNVCSRVCFEFGLASSSFVSDMSTGYSGNMGYQLPDNWAFDQFHEYSFVGLGASFPLDKDAVSGQYLGFNSLTAVPEEPEDDATEEEMLDAAYDIISPAVNSSTLGPRVLFNWEVSPIVISTPPVTIKISFKHSSLFNISEDNAKYGTYRISNGSISGATWTATQELFDSLDAQFKTDIGLTDWSLIHELVQSVENGKISLGVKFSSTGQLTFYVVIEQYLGSTDTVSSSVSVKFEFIIDNEDDDSNDDMNHAYQESLEQQESVLAVVAIGALVVVGIVAAAASAPVTGLVAAAAAFFLMISTWLTGLFDGDGGGVV